MLEDATLIADINLLTNNDKKIKNAFLLKAIRAAVDVHQEKLKQLKALREALKRW